VNKFRKAPRVRPSLRPCSTATTEDIAQPKGVTEFQMFFEILIRVEHRACVESPIYLLYSKRVEYLSRYLYWHITNIGEPVTPPMPTTPKPITRNRTEIAQRGCDGASTPASFLLLSTTFSTHPRPLDRTSVTKLLLILVSARFGLLVLWHHVSSCDLRVKDERRDEDTSANIARKERFLYSFMDYTREGGYYYPMENGPDKDDEEDINGMVVHEKTVAGRNTVSYEFLSCSYLTPLPPR